MNHLRRRTILFGLGTAIVYVILFLFVDRWVDLWVLEHCSHSWVHQAGTFFSYLGDGSYIRLAVALGFLLILAVDPETRRPRTRVLLYVCISCAIAIVIGEGLKFLMARHRPVMLFENSIYGLSYLSSEWSSNSTPSGHTLRAFAILTALSLKYRRLAPAFITLAVLIGISRVLVTDHYPSDILFGAYIGIFSAMWAYWYFYRR